MRLCSAKCLGVCDAVFLSCVFIFLVWICLSQSDSNKTQNTNKIKELSVIKFGKRFTYCHIMLLINEWNLASSPLAGAPNWNKLMFSEQKVVKLFSFMYNSQTTKLPYKSHISNRDCGAWLGGLGLSSRQAESSHFARLRCTESMIGLWLLKCNRGDSRKFGRGWVCVHVFV